MDDIKTCHRCAAAAGYEEDMAIILCTGCGFYMEQSSMTVEELIAYWNVRAKQKNE